MVRESKNVANHWRRPSSEIYSSNRFIVLSRAIIIDTSVICLKFQEDQYSDESHLIWEFRPFS